MKENLLLLYSRLIRTIKKKIYKYMSSVSKNVYIDKLDDILNKYSDTYHCTIKMNPADVKSSTCINFNKENNEEDPKFKVGNHVRMSKYKTIFAKGYVPNWSKEVFVIKKVKSTVPWKYVISDLNHEKIVRMFYEKEWEKPNQKEFRVGKVIIVGLIKSIGV